MQFFSGNPKVMENPQVLIILVTFGNVHRSVSHHYFKISLSLSLFLSLLACGGQWWSVCGVQVQR